MHDGEELKRRNRAVAGAAVGVVVVMGGLVAVSPIFYHVMSAYIGYGGALPQTSEVRSLHEAGAGKDLTVRLDTNVEAGLDVDFRAEKRLIETEIGRPTEVYYEVRNAGAAPVVIRTTFDVTPAWTAPYFFRATAALHPLERLNPQESVRVPFIFYVDPRILKDRLAGKVGAVTLSYTLFRQKGMNGDALEAVHDLATQSAAFSQTLEKDGTATFSNDAPSD